MRINMWMIANRLEGLDVQLNLHEESPQILRSARLVYAPNCVHLRQEGNDVLCVFSDEYIRIRDMELIYAFELVQGIFDTYDDWYARSVSKAVENKWDEIIEDLGYIMQSPVVFFDSNNRVVAMTKAYSSVEVDEEWDYLSRYGVSSTKMMRSGRKNIEREKENWSIQITKNPENMACGIITTRIHTAGETYGYISALEFNRRFNDGDRKVLLLLTELLTPAFALSCNSGTGNIASNCFRALLFGESVDEQALNLQMKYFNMQEKDQFRVSVLRPERQDDIGTLQVLKNNILCNCVLLPLLIVDDHIVLISNLNNHSDYSLYHLLSELCSIENLHVGVSVECQDIHDIWAYYQQALFALEYSDKSENRLHYFCAHAVDYILKNTDAKRMICACHPGVRRLFEQNRAQSEDLLSSLEMYLYYERSLMQAARELFVHKNTLLYRIRKAEETCGCNLDSPAEREYIMISIRVLRLFGR